MQSERELHQQIRKLLDAHGIVYFESRMDKRTTQRKGTPDFLFSINGKAIALEVKINKNKLSREQEIMAAVMMGAPNLWKWFETRSIDEAGRILEKLWHI